jgi:D-alanine-D-alanine ligase
MTRNIAILTGGDSAERIISHRSAAVVRAALPADRYRTFLIDIEGMRWIDQDSGCAVDKNDFSLTLPDGEKVTFAAAFAALHGSPLEDGKMQGYLDMVGLPYTCCDGYVSALAMNKHNCKVALQPHHVPMAPSVLLRRGEPVDVAALLALGLPLFVKPNTHGSSFGVTKVKTADQLLPAIEAVWPYDAEAVIEAFMPGREFSNGVARINGEVVVLPITEIIPETEFFDFAAKYEGKSQEITPANLTPALTAQCQELSRRLYELLHCQGVVRFDAILVGDTFHFLEANTIPGLTSASMIPQQTRAAGWELGDFFAALIEEALAGSTF